jgi:hypothetical protein
MAINWDYGVVAFLDVLGFANFVESDAKSLHPKHLDKLLHCIKEVKAAAKDLDVRAFSDSIVISAPLNSGNVANLLHNVANLQRIFVRSGVLVRGAIAFGKHFADENLVYSEELISAYVEERDDARFPRILVNKNLLDWFMNNAETDEASRAAVAPILLADRDSRVFLNYLDPESLQSQLKVLREYQVQNVSPTVLEKIQWLAGYHNYVAAQLDVASTFDGPMLQGFRKI